MDPRARLDHAVFHLTPTRTRCDLVAFCGKSSEKLASGLLEPFVSHLKVAKDEILKGGYSITLRPTSHLDSNWFTKATFQRFVRFVSTPDILERFVSIEKEIQQIVSSIQSNESPSDSDKAQADVNAVDDAAKGENSKARLQRVLGSRQAILRREQAMAYQRALVLGFDLGSVDDLLAFADCFGASRLKEACVNFRELCVMKHNDRLWMDELAAVKAFAAPEQALVGTQAIVLTSEIEPNDTDGKDQAPSENGRGSMPWPGQYPPFMYNYQNPMQQGQHPFPMMQPYPPYYPPNMQWSPNMDQSGGHHRRRSGSRKKGRSSDETASEEDSQSEYSDSASDSDADEYNKQSARNHSSGERGHKKKNKKKPSKTVVIRNINYITSKHGEEDAVYDSDYESRGLEKSGRKNGKLEKEGSAEYENGLITSASGVNRSSDTWDNFQNLLLRNKESDTDVSKQDYSPYVDKGAMDMGGEKARVQQRSLPSDAFVSSNGYIQNGSGMSLEELESNKSFRPAARRGDIGGEGLIFSRGFDEHNGVSSNFAAESAVKKTVKAEDWSIANQSGTLKNQNGTTEHKSFDGSYELSPAGNQYSAGSKKGSFVDDSIMVQSHSVSNAQEDSQWKTDISMLLDQTVAAKAENGAADVSEDKLARRLSYEPDDMFFMPERDSGRVPDVASFTPQMDFGAEISFSRDQRRNSGLDESAEDENKPGKKASESGDKKPKDAKPKGVPRYLSNSKLPEVKNKKPFSSKPAVHKSKQEKEDDIRRKMEELVIERQKRIAERSAAAATKKPAPKVPTKSR
uniref:COP1-interacting protein 7 n=1 Tax=Kalanchoe fedtschenkoi TaxID=63787 RepID=A0A7N0V2K1_KALFE